MADLPLEVIIDILSRLPVKSVLRFRCTCKSWRSLIDGSHFISFHLHKSLETNRNNLVIFRQNSDLQIVDFDTLDAAVEVVHPLMCYGNRLKVLGSCNGLLCICNVAEDIALWNPSIRKHKILALLPVERRPESDTSLFAARVYGFGYDSFSDDYKLLRISYYIDLHSRTFDSQVKLYSLRTNSWKTIQHMPYALCCARTMGVFVGGALHWVVTRKLEPDAPDLIIAFDLKYENFREVPLPDLGNQNFQMEVALLGRSLCMLANYQNTRVDIWVMKEYGHKETWCNLFTLNESHELGSLKFVRPLAYSRDGNKVFLELDHKRLCWFDLKNNGISSIQIPRMPPLIDGTICLGSLVPPALESRIDKQQQELEAKKERDAFLSEGFKLVL
ncbi:F-box protein CPR1 [Neltuma alba]|uniref:F-box protein CPR1-like n=1 Tax=Neltuma alba TaxID=207710 RepID=UPI0010A44C92|nr:F-box protein CPR1-like [Prosopis alba]XP_028755313.1 F-box protein CPR1-like [Prosopis alba]XP_028755314.1 F-box protein CPR1-like [Prosopis alba]